MTSKFSLPPDFQVKRSEKSVLRGGGAGIYPIYNVYRLGLPTN